jgi:hypothetical protein
MTPGTNARLGNRFAIPTSAVQRRRLWNLRFLPGLLANHEMAQRSIPALPKPVTGKCLQGSVTKKDGGAAHSIQARSSLLQQRPDTFAQTYSVILFFRLQNGGGPYIPVWR